MKRANKHKEEAYSHMQYSQNTYVQQIHTLKKDLAERKFNSSLDYNQIFTYIPMEQPEEAEERLSPHMQPIINIIYT